MLGHKVVQRARVRHDTWTTVRGDRPPPIPELFDEARSIGGVDATDPATVARAIREVRPDAVIDCIGIVKQRPAAKDPVTSIRINALFPHLLAEICGTAGARLVHISTDCVFSGRRGAYTETDPTDAEDLYGRSKALGEVTAPHAVTLRTSMIGRELSGHYGLVDWFLRQRGGRVPGYQRAIFSGFTTSALSDIILDVIEHHPGLSGLYHVSAEPVNKYDLLRLLNDAYGTDTEIVADGSVAIDRSLDSSRFRMATGYRPAPWADMIGAMAQDPTSYDSWSRTNVS